MKKLLMLLFCAVFLVAFGVAFAGQLESGGYDQVTMKADKADGKAIEAQKATHVEVSQVALVGGALTGMDVRTSGQMMIYASADPKAISRSSTTSDIILGTTGTSYTVKKSLDNGKSLYIKDTLPSSGIAAPATQPQHMTALGVSLVDSGSGVNILQAFALDVGYLGAKTKFG